MHTTEYKDRQCPAALALRKIQNTQKNNLRTETVLKGRCKSYHLYVDKFPFDTPILEDSRVLEICCQVKMSWMNVNPARLRLLVKSLV